MTLKIEIASDGETATFRLSGHIEEDHLIELQAEVQRYRPRLAFDLAETTLVDLAVVRFLAAHAKLACELSRRVITNRTLHWEATWQHRCLMT